MFIDFIIKLKLVYKSKSKANGMARKIFNAEGDDCMVDRENRGDESELLNRFSTNAECKIVTKQMGSTHGFSSTRNRGRRTRSTRWACRPLIFLYFGVLLFYLKQPMNLILGFVFD